MLISKKQGIDDLIVESLAKNPYVKGPELLALINEKRPKTTKQAVYTALSALLDDEIVAKVGAKYFLSRVWIHKIEKALGQKGSSKDMIFDLKDGESVSYHFPSLLFCDNYWAHIVNILSDYLEKGALFLWHPHYWFVVGREKIERDILERLSSNGIYSFFTIGGDTLLDKDFREKWRSENVQINIADKRFPFNYYLQIWNDFIIEIYIDKNLAKEVESFYQSEGKSFEDVLKKKTPIRMKISRNKNKAHVLRKKLSKDFFVPKELKMQ